MDSQEIRKWHSIFKPNNELFEIRIIGDKTFSGYFYDIETAIKAIEPYDNCNIYYTINEVNGACASRSQFNSIKQVKGTATSKNDIVHRWWLAIDVDCERPSGVSSSDTEKEFAHKKAQSVYKFLSENNIPNPVVCDSSSGYHLLYPIDFENDQESEDVIKNFLEILSNIFTDDHVKIDKVLHDANRILRLPGSLGRKGISTDIRPHRLAKILSVPNEIVRLKIDILKEFNKKFKLDVDVQNKTQFKQGIESEFNLRDFIAKHNIEVDREISISGGGTKYILKECPFDSQHKAPDSAIFELPNGAIAFKCFHNSCSQYDWKAFRLHYEPDAYTKKNDNYENVRGYRRPIKPKFEIKEELPELGKKWFCMKDIKKVDISDLTFIPTGYNSIDMLINGLCLGQVSIMSGKNSAGKTSFLNSIAMNAVDAGFKTAIWSREIPSYLMNTWLQMVAAGKEYMKPSKKSGFYYVPNEIADKINEWTDGRLFIYNNEYPSQWEQLLNDMKILVKAGVKLFILDNLFSMNVDIFDGDNNDKHKALIMEIMNFAKENNIHIILVAHPRKATTFLRKEDIKGTGVLSDAVDNIFIIHRVNNDFIKAGGEFFGNSLIQEFSIYGNVVEIAKDRLFGKMGHLCGLFFDEISKRFLNTETENRRYGWNEEPHQIEIKPEQASISDGITNNKSFDSNYTQSTTNYSQSEENDYSDNDNNQTDDNFGLPY